tara:strand:+ start:363 stop:575 length:213 start_codon:yes stop_codon:yes gene_type:complete
MNLTIMTSNNMMIEARSMTVDATHSCCEVDIICMSPRWSIRIVVCGSLLMTVKAGFGTGISFEIQRHLVF